MSVTSEEILIILRCEASEELRARFMADMARPDSDAMRLLKDAETWARTELNPNAPSPPASTPRTTDVQILKRAAFSENDDEDELGTPPLGVPQLLECLRGTASMETTARVKQALADPNSELSLLFNRMRSESK